MRIALMLTGLARKVQEGYDRYWKQMIENHDVDLYLHAWYSKPDEITNNEDSDIVTEVYSKHSPNFLYIQVPFPFTEYREGIDNPNNDKSRPLDDFDVYGNFRSFPMFYSWESTYKQIINSENDYDCIIRSRYDIAGDNLDMSKLDLSKINTSGHAWRGREILDDNLLITNQKNADKIFSNIFTDIVNHHKKLGYIHNAEGNFTEYLKRNNLYELSVKTHEINFSVLRDNKLWF